MAVDSTSPQNSEAQSGKAQIGVTGLAVMGANLARNLARNGYTVALHNRTIAKTDELLDKHGGDGDFIRTETLQDLVDSLERPRRILVMVKAGAPVDAVIENLIPLLDTDDIIIDGGNSYFKDTIRREKSRSLPVRCPPRIPRRARKLSRIFPRG
jgi:6-phosphogluconate dehydrogenase